MKSKQDVFFCGTSNVVLPVPNKAFFPEAYQDRSRLAYYGSLFNSVEVNSTFYKLPMPGTVARWAVEVPDSFRFTFKLWKGITHAKELLYNPNDVRRFLDIISHAGEKIGCLLIQFPASIKVSFFRKVQQLLDQIRQTGRLTGCHLAVEFRDASWYRDNVYEMLERYHAGVVRHDMPRSATPFTNMREEFAFFRFHGEQGDYRGSYSEELLMEQALYIRELLEEGLSVFAYFNNTIGDAFNNAVSLRHYVNAGS